MRCDESVKFDDVGVDRIDNPGGDQREPLAQTHGLDLLLDDAVLIAFDGECRTFIDTRKIEADISLMARYLLN